MLPSIQISFSWVNLRALYTGTFVNIITRKVKKCRQTYFDSIEQHCVISFRKKL